MHSSNGHADPFESNVMYTRPPVPAFNSFLSNVVERTKGPTMMAAKAMGITVSDDGIKCITLSNGDTIRCHRLVLAVGNGSPRIPAWAETAAARTAVVDSPAQPQLYHTSNLGSLPASQLQGKRVLVVGGGMSAAHACLLATEASADVTLLSRHPLREQEFDATLPWFSRYEAHAQRCAFYQADARVRAEIIAQARGGASISSDVLARLREAMAKGTIVFRQGEVASLAADGTQGEVHLELADGESARIEVDVVVLATGFNTTVEGQPLLKQLWLQHDWPTVNGLPILDTGLEWAEGIHMLGSFAGMKSLTMARQPPSPCVV